jgi:hypothetical protein
VDNRWFPGSGRIAALPNDSHNAQADKFVSSSDDSAKLGLSVDFDTFSLLSCGGDWSRRDAALEISHGVTSYLRIADGAIVASRGSRRAQLYPPEGNSMGREVQATIRPHHHSINISNARAFRRFLSLRWIRRSIAAGVPSSIGDHVDVRVSATVLSERCANFKYSGRAARFIDEMMAIGIVIPERHAVPGAQWFFAGVSNQR